MGFDWKWLFIYPDERIATVNQLVMPVGRPVHISLTSGTVMQALLIPQLAGQIYAMAGMTTQLNLAASRPGVYRGENTQFNGAGFQNEKFNAVALPPADYDRWVAQAQASGHPLDAAAYAELFKKSSPPQADCLLVGPAGSVPAHPRPVHGGPAMTEGIWPAVLGRFVWHALPFVRAWENPTASEIIGACRRLDRHRRRCVRRRADHVARQVALSLVRMAHQPRSQENRHHVRRPGLRDAQRAR